MSYSLIPKSEEKPSRDCRGEEGERYLAVGRLQPALGHWRTHGVRIRIGTKRSQPCRWVTPVLQPRRRRGSRIRHSLEIRRQWRLWLGRWRRSSTIGGAPQRCAEAAGAGAVRRPAVAQEKEIGARRRAAEQEARTRQGAPRRAGRRRRRRPGSTTAGCWEQAAETECAGAGS
jgi:hypothetical protein